MYRTTMRIFKEFPSTHYKRAMLLISEHTAHYEITAVVDGDTLIAVEIDTDRDLQRFLRIVFVAYPEIYRPFSYWHKEQCTI